MKKTKYLTRVITGLLLFTATAAPLRLEATLLQNFGKKSGKLIISAVGAFSLSLIFDPNQMFATPHCAIASPGRKLWSNGLAFGGTLAMVTGLVMELTASIQSIIEQGQQVQLIFASRVGTLDEMQRLVNAGRNVNVKDDYGHDALYYAVQNGDLVKINFLLKKGASNLDASSGLLHYASQNGDFEIVKLLREHGAPVDAKGLNGLTPLMEAVRGNSALASGHENRHQDVVLYLLGKYNGEDGANINKKGENGRTALHLAAMFNDGKMVSLLIKNGAKRDIFDTSSCRPINLTTDSAIKGLLSGK